MQAVSYWGDYVDKAVWESLRFSLAAHLWRIDFLRVFASLNCGRGIFIKKTTATQDLASLVIVQKNKPLLDKDL